MSRVLRKPAFSICKNKDADQLCGYRKADQHLCFRYTDTKIPLLSNSEISSFYPSSVAVQTGMCRTWSETPKTGFLKTRLICEACFKFLPRQTRLCAISVVWVGGEANIMCFYITVLSKYFTDNQRPPWPSG